MTFFRRTKYGRSTEKKKKRSRDLGAPSQKRTLAKTRLDRPGWSFDQRVSPLELSEEGKPPLERLSTSCLNRRAWFSLEPLEPLIRRRRKNAVFLHSQALDPDISVVSSRPRPSSSRTDAPPCIGTSLFPVYAWGSRNDEAPSVSLIARSLPALPDNCADSTKATTTTREILGNTSSVRFCHNNNRVPLRLRYVSALRREEIDPPLPSGRHRKRSVLSKLAWLEKLAAHSFVLFIRINRVGNKARAASRERVDEKNNCTCTERWECHFENRLKEYFDSIEIAILESCPPEEVTVAIVLESPLCVGRWFFASVRCYKWILCAKIGSKVRAVWGKLNTSDWLIDIIYQYS